MKDKYEKPKTKVVMMQGRRHLLVVSGTGMSVNMSSYQEGGNGSGDSDGWEN